MMARRGRRWASCDVTVVEGGKKRRAEEETTLKAEAGSPMPSTPRLGRACGASDLSESRRTVSTEYLTESERSPNRESGGLEDSSAGCRRVHFADEVGQPIKAEVQVPDWWDALLFGTPKACCPAPAAEGKDYTMEGGVEAHSAGPVDKKMAHQDLIRFVSELGRGVQVILRFPGLGSKPRDAILYSEDNGDSLSWVETGMVGNDPYTVRSTCLLKVEEVVEPVREGSWRALRWRRRGSGAGEDGGSSGQAKPGRPVVKLKWRAEPGFPPRKVWIELVDVPDPKIFVQGMERLHELHL